MHLNVPAGRHRRTGSDPSTRVRTWIPTIRAVTGLIMAVTGLLAAVAGIVKVIS